MHIRWDSIVMENDRDWDRVLAEKGCVRITVVPRCCVSYTADVSRSNCGLYAAQATHLRKPALYARREWFRAANKVTDPSWSRTEDF